ncbi:hypothetical protein [Alkalicoccobacillus murimartini]|uniref:Phosphate/sulfate permease n=1 Tax=Alkalicoccobacillus murimartini TaxID=171685 RepID=A0ABT9YDA4_9BACI|nr:hypothetical protein [Alkalicoccobacillus murimartini]MDQ0205820.1 phosphate/sulfate permease [Alkalicoccobacillus murimartini]
MVDSFKTFFITFVLVPSILGVGMAFSVELFPFLWSLITQKEVDLAFKNLAISFLLGYLIYVVYRALVYKFSKNKDKVEMK